MEGLIMLFKTYLIEELIKDISMGPFGSDIKKEVYQSSGIPVLNGSNLFGFKLNEDSFGYVSEEKANQLFKCNAHRGDIVVTHRGTLGQIIYIPNDSKYERYVISQSQFRLTCDDTLVIPEYLVYYFHTKIGQNKLLSNASQVGVPALARATTTFRKIEILIPPIYYQKEIIKVLLSLDAKIETNNKLNEKLEEMAQAIFKSWFVDFEPFKDQPFHETEIGYIPQIFESGVLGDLCTFKRGKGLLSKDAIPGDVPVIAGGMKPACYHNVANTKAPVVTVSGSGANAGYTQIHNVDVWASDCSFIDSNCENLYYAYCFLSRRPKLLKHSQTGAAQPHVKPADIHRFQVVIPTKEIINEFQQIVKPLFDRIGMNKIENDRLASLRDTLLPRLMSGEIKI